MKCNLYKVSSMNNIDAVVTWVDGNDPIHNQKRNSYEHSGNIQTIPSSQDITRFINNGELEFCLLALLKNAPWINSIHIVTDNQKPNFTSKILKNSNKIKIVDHQDIFKNYENFLPTFNSISIESMLHFIPGLSEKYVYLNDDFIILKAVKEEDFFIKDKAVLKGQWQKIQNYGKIRLIISQILNSILKKTLKINRSMSLLQQMRAALLAGFSKNYFKSPHYPHPQLKNTIKNFYDENSDVLVKNIRHKFRNLDQHVAIFLSNHLEIKKNNAVLETDDDCLMICFNRDSPRSIKKKLNLLSTTNNVKFLCVQSLEEATDDHKQQLLEILDKKYALG